MKHTVAILAAVAAQVSAQVSAGSEPAPTPPPQATQTGAESNSGCQETVDGPFKLTIIEGEKAKRGIDGLEPANCEEGGLILTLNNGILKDQASRTGYISSNFQLQFDDPPQSGALAGDGFTLCADGNLALKGEATFFECPTGDFWNLYDRQWAEHCSAVHLVAKPCGAEGEMAEKSAVGGGTTVVPTKVITELEDGQAQVRSTDIGKVVCQIEDGQVQGHASACVNTAQVTGTAVPSTTGTAHNHTSSAPTIPEDPSATEDDDSGALGLGFHASAACVGLVVGYFAMAALL